MTGAYKKSVIEKVQTLPKELLVQVDDFIDFIKAKHAKLSKTENVVNEPPSLYGAAKGLFVISDDFNEPLDDFKEYM